MADAEKLETLLQNVNFIEDDFALEENNSAGQNSKFDEEIGYVEDIIVSKRFQDAQERFMMKYFDSFRRSTESNYYNPNKIHEEYKNILGCLLEKEMKKQLPDFCMNDLMNYVENNRKDLEGEVFEVILSFKDFISFKETIIDYGKAKKGEVEDLRLGVQPTPLSARSDVEMQSPSSSINCTNSLDCEMISPRSFDQAECDRSIDLNKKQSS